MNMEPRRLEDRTNDFVNLLSNRAQALSKLLRAARKWGSQDGYNPERVIEGLETAASATAAWADLEAARTQLLGSWRETLAAALLQLEADLREVCRARGWRLDGQWPDFVVDYGVSIHVDEEARSVLAGDVRCPANAPSIMNALIPQVSGLLPKNFSPQRFMESLLHAYQAAADSKSTQVRIVDVYRWFVIQAQSPRFWRDAKASLFTPCTTDQFRARLAKSLESGVSVVDRRELRLLPPLDPKDALFVYQPAERRFGYIGRIEFAERREGDR
jgi:hypothetical protein